jgi:hypothetical protein
MAALLGLKFQKTILRSASRNYLESELSSSLDVGSHECSVTELGSLMTGQPEPVIVTVKGQGRAKGSFLGRPRGLQEQAT